MLITLPHLLVNCWDLLGSCQSQIYYSLCFVHICVCKGQNVSFIMFWKCVYNISRNLHNAHCLELVFFFCELLTLILSTSPYPLFQEHVVHAWEDTNPIFHNALVHQYREHCQELLTQSSSSPSPVLEEELQSTRNKLLQFLDKSAHYTPETVLILFPSDCK